MPVQRHAPSFTPLPLDDDHDAVVFSRGQPIIEKSDAKIYVVTAAILLAIGGQLGRPIAL